MSAQDGKDLACIAEMYLLDENGERLSREPWIVNYADSEDVSHVNCSADKIFDLHGINLLEHNKRHSIPAFCRD